MKIADYFSGIERSLRRAKGAKISAQITSLASDDYNGLLRRRVLFWDESYLDVYEVVNTEFGIPVQNSLCVHLHCGRETYVSV